MNRLREGALGLVQSVAIGIAGTAPAYTLAASTAALVGAVGALAPASLFYCGLIMAGITFAFASLNREQPDPGASYAWVSRVFHPALGFLCGWAVLVSSVLFMVSATIPAATATLMLAAPDLAGSKPHVIGVAACWLLAITALEVRSVRLTGIAQAWMTGIEIAVLTGLAAVALVRNGPQVAALIAHMPFAPSAFTPGTFAAGAVIAVFFFWGWDVPLNASEETRDSTRIPGLAAVLTLLVVMGAFMALVLVTLATLDEAAIGASGANVVFAVAEKLAPRPWSYLAVLAVLLSSVGSLQVSLLQFARTLFATARSGHAHPRWSRVHERWRTPHLATWLNTALGLVLLLASLAFADIDSLLKTSINAIGLEIAFYYGLAALACAWHLRHATGGKFFLAVAWPLASAIALWAAAALAALSMDAATLAIGIGGLLSGLVPLAWSSAPRAVPEH